MAVITAKDVAALRAKTGIGMMECKKALVEADGNMEAAVKILREKGELKAQSKIATRIAADGLVDVMKEGDTTAIIEVNSETDFVAKNADFNAFVEACAKTVIAENPADLAALMACKIAGGTDTVEEALREKILTIGENLKIRRFERYEGDIVTYIHGGGRIGVMVLFEAPTVSGKDEFKTYAKDVAMQIAAVTPTYVCKEDVPAEVVEKEKEILTVQAINEGKPANIAEKMVMGRINKYYKEVCLLEQPFVKNGDISVGKFTQDTAKELGGDIKVIKFVRFEKGEGLEKREENFAEEIAKQLGK